MNKFTVHTPIWNTMSIGIDGNRLTDDLLIEIDYKLANGNRMYNDIFIVKKDSWRKYPIQQIRGHNLVIIPIRELKVYEKREVVEKAKGGPLKRINKFLSVEREGKTKQVEMF